MPDRQGQGQQKRRRHASGKSLRNVTSASGLTPMRRTSCTATTDRPYLRNAHSFANVIGRVTCVTRKHYHLSLKPDIEGHVNRNLLIAAVVIGLSGSFQSGFNVSALNQQSQLVKIFLNETYSEREGAPISSWRRTWLWSLSNALLFFPGGALGSFVAGCAANCVGPRRTLLASHVFGFAGSLSSAACVQMQLPELLLLGRFLLGVNLGISFSVAPTFLCEISPFNLRGSFAAVHQLAVCFGILTASVLGLPNVLGTRNLWPFVMLFESFPSLVSCVTLPWLPDSPRFLLLIKHDRKSAQKALQFYQMSEDVLAHMEELDTEHLDVADSSLSAFRYLFGGRLRTAAFTSLALQAFQQLSGANAIFMFSFGMFCTSGLSEEFSQFAVVAVNAAHAFSAILSLKTIERFGRRRLLILPNFLMIATLTLLASSHALLHQHDPTLTRLLVVVCIAVYVAIYGLGPGVVPTFVVAELFRQSPRPLAVSASVCVNCLAGFLLCVSFERIQSHMSQLVFLLCLIPLAGSILVAFLAVPETRRQTFEETATSYVSSAMIEVQSDVTEEHQFPQMDEFADDAHAVTINFGPRPDRHDEDSDISDDEAEGLVMRDLV